MLKKAPAYTSNGRWSKPCVRFLVAGLAAIVFYFVFIYSFRSQSDTLLLPVSIEQIMTGNPIPVPELPQDDPRIIDFIKRNGYLKEPSTNPYSLTSPTKDPSMGQGQIIRKLLNQQRDGFFIECGALDGETRSNTLYMEKELGWKGLLIEADPSNYQSVLSKQRKAWTSNSCLATRPYPHEVIFRTNFNTGKIFKNSTNLLENGIKVVDNKSGVRKKKGTLVRVQCFPIYSLLSAMGVTTVDYFSLDVEGFELGVLASIPFDKVFIKTLSVEYLHDPAGKEAVRQFMVEKGYVVATEVTRPNNLANDFIFVHASFNLQRFISPT